MVDGMAWPTGLSSERYPGTVRREMTVDARVDAGLRLTRGFRAAATEVLGGVEGCTHLLTLVLAIWNHQVVSQYMLTRTDDGSHPDGTPDFDRMVDACSGWR